ncbi:MAG: Crp/Fnr family transcriptional regulator [Actinomycetota bacterium]
MSATEVATVSAFIDERGRRTTVERGRLLFAEGDRSLSVYSCVSGSVRVFVSSVAGSEVLLGFKQPGDHFGELSAITGRPRTASAIAATDCEVAHMPGERFLAELEQVPTLAVAVLRGLADQVRTAHVRLLAHTCESVLARTGHKLVELAQLRRRHDPDARDGSVVLDITQTDLANWIDASRESVSRSLRELRSDGLVETGRCHITVRDLDALQRSI